LQELLEPGDFYSKEVHKMIPLITRGPSIERQQILSSFVLSNTLLLDVGCGDCSFNKFLDKVEYVGIDINRQILRKGKLRKVDVVLASCDFLPFKNRVFDACSMLEVIEHLYFPERALKEVHRVLKEKGKLLLATPNFVNFIDRINVLMGKHPIAGTEHLHIRFFTWKTLNTLLRRCGFELEKRENWFIPFPIRTIAEKYPLWRKIMRYAAKVFPNFDEGLLGVWRKFG
jgi:SAM-dependent methyltransferase